MSMSSTAEEPTVLFESHGALRRYILNRPKKLNALDGTMIDALHPKIQEWGASELCKIIVGDGKGKAFCAGGDVRAVIMDAANEETRSKATGYFKKEFELDYQLATLSKPYVCILDGFTMGGGVGLSAHSPFRIATENTTFAMPETKIGYCPDVGASYFLPRLDGEIGTYLGLTGESVKGRAVFENGLATHFVPSRRIPQLLDILGSMEEPTLRGINAVIEEHYGEPSQEEEFGMIAGDLRVALDTAFGHNSVEEIFDSLREMEKSNSAIVGEWAKKTRSILDLRSPTSLKVALQAIRRGKTLSLASALRMEMGIATAFIIGASPDFTTGVTKVLVEGDRENRPAWSPASLSQVSKALVKQFFDDSEYLSVAPELSLEEDMAANNGHFNNFGLPSEIEIKQIVRGEHKQSGALALTLDELIQKFRSMRGDKNGLDLKVSEVVERKCDCDAEGYLRWK
ncbi:hypothetical protein EW145_g3897 [Phellinidium pouzarii]|uniref:3-hydroxyisobutyryl-CoA hydrolase n=1 Tax=Phellinidium pouzarii TaxID=167371 RepID=A0A4S4LAP1_9AGAM|nr:hypothetical protein EW145_g3897 [Phellinidium pouzarii]